MSGDQLTSIVLLHYNRPKDVGLCLESIRRHTSEPYEILLVDNGSPDPKVKEYLRSIPDIILIDIPENISMGTVTGRAVALAKGQFLTALSDDVIVTPGWLGRFLKHAENNPHVGLMGPRSNFVSGPQLVKNMNYKDIRQLDDFARKWSSDNEGRLTPYTRLVGFCMFVRRAVVEKIGWTDPGFGFGFDDDDFSLRVNLAGFTSAIAQDVFIHHTGGPQLKGDPHHQKLIREAWKTFTRKWQLPPDRPFGVYVRKELLRRQFDPARDSISLPDPAEAEEYVFRRAQTPPSSDTRQEEFSAKPTPELPSISPPFESSAKPLLPGQVAYYSGNLHEAIEKFHQAAADHSHLAQAHFALGICLMESGHGEQALGPLRRAMELEPHVADIGNGLGFALKELGRDVEAETAFQNAERISLYDQRARLNLIRLYREQGRFDEAHEKAIEAYQRTPDNPGVLVALADLYAERQEFEEASEHIEKALELNLDDLKALLLSCKVAIQWGNPEQALNTLRKIREIAGGRRSLEGLLSELNRIEFHAAGAVSDKLIPVLTSLLEQLRRQEELYQCRYWLSSMIDDDTKKELFDAAKRLYQQGKRQQGIKLYNGLRELYPEFAPIHQG